MGAAFTLVPSSISIAATVTNPGDRLNMAAAGFRKIAEDVNYAELSLTVKRNLSVLEMLVRFLFQEDFRYFFL